MKTTRNLIILVSAICLILCSTQIGLAADVGTAFTYQGHLYDNNDVANDLYDFQFRLYDANVDYNQIGSDVNVADVDVIDGYFTVELDFGDSMFDGNAVWLEIGVRPGIMNDPNVYSPLAPRQTITPTPYALYAASGPDVTAPLELTGSLASPEAVISGTNTGSGTGVHGEHSGTGNFGQLGRGDYGVYGYTTNSSGVYGKNITTGNYGYLGGTANGARGWSATGKGVLGGSNSGYGVLGEADTGTGVYGRNTNSGNYGELGLPGCGVFGKHDVNNNFGYIASSEYGVYGNSFSGTGVYGKHDLSDNYGELGTSSYGVYGKNGTNHGWIGGSTTGVRGNSTGTTSYGVYGYNPLGTGVKGISYSGTGVHGKSTTGEAGYFEGDVYVTKNVSALSFTDRTPYPKDLATAYDAVMSMKRLPDGRYEENNKEHQLDHSKLNSFISAKDGGRDLSATVSCLNEVVKDLVKKVEAQQKRIETQNRQIQQMTEMLQTNNNLRPLL